MKKLTLFICLFISICSIAQPFSKLKDINSTATSNGISSVLFQRVGNTVYFLGNDGITGNELWKSDGTEAGTVLVKDITPGSASTIFSNIMLGGNGLLFFTADDPVNGREPWISDGTAAGTFLLKDINPGTATSGIARGLFHNGNFYFGADDGVNGQELWKSDGTTAGTVLVKDILPGASASSPGSLSNPIYTFVGMGNEVYFGALGPVGGRELWKSDGTAAGTVMVKDIFPGANGSVGATTHKAFVFNGKLYFAGNDGLFGSELWVTDGTDAGTYRVKDIVSGSGNSIPNDFTIFNGELFFTASSVNNGNPDLYKTDGTEAGTVLVRSLSADGIVLTTANSSAINSFVQAGNKMFFRATGPSGVELYATDGTGAGTGLVKDIFPGTTGANPQALFEFLNKVYFTALDPSNNRTIIYSSDGTENGTLPVLSGPVAANLSVTSGFLLRTDSKFFFYGSDPDGFELWVSDGTTAGTSKTKDINQLINGTPNTGSTIFGSVIFNGDYYFGAGDPVHGMELWKSDGTTAGTVMVKDIWPGSGASVPSNLTVFNGVLYFVANDGTSGNELWKTDGTEAGTVMVAEIAPGSVGSSIFRLIPASNYLYFSAVHPSYGFELWRTDGTAAGTALVADLVTGPSNGISSIQDGVTIGNDTYLMSFIAAGNTLGLPAGTKLLKVNNLTNTVSELSSLITTVIDIQSSGNTLYITGRNASNQTLLWKSDNGGAVTQVKLLSTTATNAYQLTNCGGKIYFAGSNGTAAGVEPWISDGTDAGTYMLKDINPGTNPSSPYQFVFSGGKTFFTASSTGNSNGEYELWATDGTTAGTYLVKDILPGNTGSRPNATIAVGGNKVLFTASDGINGIELWQSDGTAAGTYLMQDFNTGSGDAFLTQAVFFNFPADHIFKRNDEKIFFFARNNVTGFQPYSGSIANPYKYVNDNSTFNDVFTTAIGSNANNGSQSAPYATLQYAVSQAAEGDTIYVDAGVFTEQVTIDKGITLVGAGSGLTIVLKPSGINPPPGPFGEPGTIQTIQNIGDVHIRDMSITGDNTGVTPIVIQSGGSVKNCRLIGGNQGIFFRVNPAVKSALIENNYINVEYIGINCQGSGLTATLLNNTIDLNNPGFTAGVYAGLDFGPLVRFTAFGNSINNYKTQGFLANSYNTNITQNSIVGTGQYAIQQYVGVLSVATCNWYGTTDAGTIASKISGVVTYTPYLNSGTNTNTVYGNYSFVPVANSCSEGVSNYYVNDNSLTNDVFTTAIGNNTNTGTRNAPFATLSYAVSVAPANSVIHVDAGTYAEQVIIDRSIVINGAGKDLANFIKPATPLVPAPGSFTEIGLIETTQGIGDVHIRGISVNSVDGSSQNIIIQAGGSVRNCKLLNGGQGVFFRIESGSRNATVDANMIQPIGIAINCQGAGLTANISRNTISNPAGYYSAIFAGLDFGPLPQLNITNNAISNYFGDGMYIGANGSNITQNSIMGTGSVAIRKVSGNTLNATCNWYGSATPAVSGIINYSPFLTNGTDNNADPGFQPLSGICTGVQHNFYVNDNSNTGNVFTTAPGDDANSGAPSAPLLTIAAALNKAQTGDIIYVDAGTYAANVVVNKSVTLRGVKYGLNPGSSLDRGNETIIVPSVTNLTLIGGSVVRITASNVTLDGFTIDGNNPNINSGTVLNGVDINAATGVFNDDNVVSDLTVKNNIVKNTGTYGIALFRTFGNSTGPVVSGNLFTQNRVDNTGIRGVVFAYSAYGSITNNYITRCNGSGTWFSQTNVANLNNNPGIVSGNYIEAGNLGMQSSGLGINASAIQYLNNHIIGMNANSIGLSLTVSNPSGIVVSNNKFTGLITGIAANNTGDQNNMMTVTISNNSFENISNLIFNIFNNTYFNASCNWYGSAAAQNFINKLPLAANLDIVPWLTNGTDNDPVIGFQPIPGSCDGYPPLIVLDNYSNVTCNGANNGTINITASFGRPPFVFTWTKDGDPGFVSHAEDLTGLAPGVYHLAVLDGNGSTIYITSTEADGPGTIDVTITEPALLTANASGSNVDCFNGTDGTASVLAGGGIAPYNYLWSNGAATSSISNLVAGLYTVTVTDDNGCTAQGAYQVTQPALLTATISNNSTGCFNAATVNANGGTLPYSYQWSNGATTAEISGVPAGTYSVIVIDANGCTANANITLAVGEAFNPSASVTNVTCFGGSNGKLTVTNANGIAPFSYSINGINFRAINTFDSLPAGTYTITVRDVNGCTGFVDKTITQPTQLLVSQGTVQSTCIGSNTGSISVVVSGGSPSYTYLWTGPGAYSSTQSSVSGLAAGDYTVTVSDSKGCTASLTVTVLSFPPISVNANITNVVCRSDANGSIDLTVSGGSGVGFTYLWNNGATTQDRINIAAGTYNVIITDSDNGCTVTGSYIVNQAGVALKLNSPSFLNVRGCTPADLGSITASATNGVRPCLFKLNGGNYQTDSVFTGLAPGNYTVFVKDAYGCEKSATVTIIDDGTDQYERINNQNNNAKQRASAISIGTVVNARIASGDQDWFKFTTSPGGITNYTVSVTHPSFNYSITLYRDGSNTIRQPISTTATSKTYRLGGDTTFQILITGTTSTVCYALLVQPQLLTKMNTELITAEKTPVEMLNTSVFPNPHRGNFGIKIESAQDGAAIVEILNAAGQLVAEKRSVVNKGGTSIVNFTNMNHNILFYRVRIGKETSTGKIIGPN